MADDNPNVVQLKRLRAQVVRLERERDQTYRSLQEAGVESRSRRDVREKWASDVRALTAVLLKVADRDDVPADLRQAASDAIGGLHE